MKVQTIERDALKRRRDSSKTVDKPATKVCLRLLTTFLTFIETKGHQSDLFLLLLLLILVLLILLVLLVLLFLLVLRP